jgi:hypothetical protein
MILQKKQRKAGDIVEENHVIINGALEAKGKIVSENRTEQQSWTPLECQAREN